MAKPCLPDLKTFFEIGMDPKTKLPIKLGLSDPRALKQNLKRALRIMDEQDAVNRGTWYNIPTNLTSQDLERMIYYKGQLAFFYSKELNEFYFLPFALTAKEGNGIDVYGRYRYIRPVAYNGGATGEEKKAMTPIETYLSKLQLRVIYSPLVEVRPEDLTESAVILQDYTPQLNNMNVEPRANLNDSILDVMSECIPFMRTSLILGSGVTGVRVQDGDQKTEVLDGAFQMLNSALTGVGWVPMTSTMEFQELTGTGKANNAEEYMLAMQSVDNFRLSLYGIDNGGLFEKKAHTLQSEADINGGPVGLVLQDAVTIRQNFCNIVNSIWGIGLWYEPSETIIKADLNGDGMLYDRDEGNNTGVDAGTENGGADNE